MSRESLNKRISKLQHGSSMIRNSITKKAAFAMKQYMLYKSLHQDIIYVHNITHLRFLLLKFSPIKPWVNDYLTIFQLFNLTKKKDFTWGFILSSTIARQIPYVRKLKGIDAYHFFTTPPYMQWGVINVGKLALKRSTLCTTYYGPLPFFIKSFLMLEIRYRQKAWNDWGWQVIMD